MRYPMMGPSGIVFADGTLVAGSWSYGAWYFRVMGYGLQLKASWCVPVASERLGMSRYLRIGRWRVRVLKPDGV